MVWLWMGVTVVGNGVAWSVGSPTAVSCCFASENPNTLGTRLGPKVVDFSDNAWSRIDQDPR